MPNTLINKQTGNIEVVYKRKPADQTREVLRGGGFRWHGPSKRWWAKASNETLAIAARVDPDFRPVAHERGKSLRDVKSGKARSSRASKANGVMTEANLPPIAYAGAEGRVIGKTVSGKVVRSADAAVYHQGVRVPKHSGKPTMMSSAAPSKVGRTLFPTFTSADHFDAARLHALQRDAAEVEWRVLLRRAAAQYGTPARHISGGVADNFPEAVNDQIRALAKRTREEGSASYAHYSASAARKQYLQSGLGQDYHAVEAEVARILGGAPAKAAKPNGTQASPAWDKVVLWNEVEFHPFAQGHANRRGWVRDLQHTANGPTVKLDLTKVQTPDGEWINGAKVLDQHSLSPRQGTIAVLVNGTIDGQMSAKPNGNLGEELRDRRRAAALRSAPSSARKAPPKARATAPKAAARKAPPKAPAAKRPADAPTLYAVSGQSQPMAFMSAKKTASNIVAESGANARAYNRGVLTITNTSTRRVVARWDVGPSGRFRQVKLTK